MSYLLVGEDLIGLKKAGFETLLLNDIDKDSCDTLSLNSKYDVIHDDIKNLNFKKYRGEVDLLSGGFPCQAFYAEKNWFKDTRGTLFYEFAKRVKDAAQSDTCRECERPG